MSTLRLALALTLLATAGLAAAPTAAASPDNVWVCVIGVATCQPYDGHLAGVGVKGHVIWVPDPCYTTACF
ncbi:MAG TPA: hypothetical protein VM241_08605 [Candidatus Thermoplasmatota archaeon]|nr:hypothetical protein [Candidatus Thermoplasmatota archaeon]